MPKRYQHLGYETIYERWVKSPSGDLGVSLQLKWNYADIDISPNRYQHLGFETLYERWVKSPLGDLGVITTQSAS